MTYQKTKAKLNQQTKEMEDEMLALWEKGIPMEQLGKMWGFNTRQAVSYHIDKARNRLKR